MFTGSLLTLGASALYASIVNRSDFILLLSVVGLAALGLLVLSRVKVARKWAWLVALTLAVRLPLFLSAPVLSDDYFRFLWDGRLSALGEDPYALLPEGASPELKQRIDSNGELMENMNSPRYYSVYPPFQQLLFAGISLLGQGNLDKEILLTRLLFVLADLVSLWLLMQLIAMRKGDPWHALWFALHPLLAWEGVGNLHFEAVSVPFMLGAVFLYFRYKKPWTAMLLFAFSASFKLRPLLLCALGIRHPGTWLYAGLSVLVVLAPFALFPLSSLENYRSSLALYSGSFEFNASLYYLLREAGDAMLGYNPIATLGPSLQLLALAAMLYISYRLRNSTIQDVLASAVLVYAIYFVFATTVHPWYLVVPLALAAAAGITWIVVWSFAVFLSYSHYQGGNFSENYSWIALEYFLVLLAFWIERRNSKARLVEEAG